MTSSRPDAHALERVRVVDPGVEDERVDEAVGWLEAEWKGEPYVPDDLLPTVTTA
jgi:hypothetical protein